MEMRPIDKIQKRRMDCNNDKQTEKYRKTELLKIKIDYSDAGQRDRKMLDRKDSQTQILQREDRQKDRHEHRRTLDRGDRSEYPVLGGRTGSSDGTNAFRDENERYTTRNEYNQEMSPSYLHHQQEVPSVHNVF